MPSLSQTVRSIAGRLLAQIEEVFDERKHPNGSVQTLSRRIRPGLTWVTIGYFLLMVLVLGAVRWRGESNWFFSAMLFLPSAFWLAPLIALLPLHLLVRPRLCVIPFIAFLAICFLYDDFCWSFSGEGSEPGLTVLTNNIGERQLRMLDPFLLKERPDVVALQDIWSRGGVDLKKVFPDRFMSVVGEYALASRFPIRKAEFIYPLAARFEFEYEGQPVAIYQLHMPSPRDQFSKLRGRGLVRELIGGGGFYSKEARESYARFVERKAKMSRDLVVVLQKEKLPFLVVGDFNMPANGQTANLFRSNFVDAFQQKGRGQGNTFPGYSDNRVANFLGPWLRLDYLFAGKDWEPVMCRVEPRVPAQHLAVVARFKLRTHKP